MQIRYGETRIRLDMDRDANVGAVENVKRSIL